MCGLLSAARTSRRTPAEYTRAIVRRRDLELVERSWGLLGGLTKGHVVVYRASHGLVGHHIPGAPPMLLLDHVGAKSGATRTSPLVYASDGENLVLVASKGGHPKNPAWFHNLRANPDTTVQVGSRRVEVKARVADAKERKRLWPQVVKVYGGYESYQRNTDREIPLVILEPR
jgi:deazaflavin-dependent oxidoreductase (nitroreductase family)